MHLPVFDIIREVDDFMGVQIPWSIYLNWGSTILELGGILGGSCDRPREVEPQS